MKLEFDSLVRRLVHAARGLAFVFWIYFLPVAARDLIAWRIPGATLPSAFGGGPPGGALALGGAALALGALVVILYTRRSPGGAEPTRLLRADRRFARDLGLGLGLGGVAATLVVLGMLIRGAAHWQGVSPSLAGGPGAFLGLALLLAVQSAHEELGFRGPGLRELTRAASFPLAALFLAGSFALLHAANPAMSARGALGILLAGAALAGLVRRTGDLGLAIGAHVGWNVTLGQVWGAPVSGFTLSPRLFDLAYDGAVRWTGGAFGAEASLPGLVILGLAA
ncbi:MAG: CPBP family intramembrane metalloprotease, partial [Gemmatimonadetes bacterium]|nr:CPBP family intramembrane metalloprotease [Gemmatimonadota bacterium]